LLAIPAAAGDVLSVTCMHIHTYMHACMSVSSPRPRPRCRWCTIYLHTVEYQFVKSTLSCPATLMRPPPPTTLSLLCRLDIS
jgi:hypothetical protein